MFPLSDAQVTQRLALVALGGEFEALEDPEKLKAVRLAEGVWRPRKWRVGHNPFLTDGPAEALQGTLFLHARHLYFARSQGSLTHTRDLWPRDIERVLRPYLVSASRPIQHIGAPAQASTSGSGASTPGSGASTPGSGASTPGSGASTPGSGDSPASWAVEGNKDPIPGDKLANAPDSGDGSGLDQSAVDLRVSALVAAWALVSGTAKIVLRKLPDVVSNANAIAGTSVAVRSWTAQRVRQAINAVVPAWARIGNLTLIPAMKLPKPTGRVTVVYPPVGLKKQDRIPPSRVEGGLERNLGDADTRNRYWAKFTRSGKGVLPDFDEIQVYVEIPGDKSFHFSVFARMETLSGYKIYPGEVGVAYPFQAGKRVSITGHASNSDGSIDHGYVRDWATCQWVRIQGDWDAVPYAGASYDQFVSVHFRALIYDR